MTGLNTEIHLEKKKSEELQLLKKQVYDIIEQSGLFDEIYDDLPQTCRFIAINDYGKWCFGYFNEDELRCARIIIEDIKRINNNTE